MADLHMGQDDRCMQIILNLSFYLFIYCYIFESHIT